ncbi:RebB family R body protein [Phreatobacter stygius]|uniref:Translation initiation factor 2 n=1 Tax=Phreatobacter stygius TaxID=1940610 RepID=A0A4D7B4X1_9HYPH|nr:RebB family R body protein [Phreatobacter stygius]QCI68001.1 hypothetical protein E8M01_29500 [Phreatobacter stygius]
MSDEGTVNSRVVDSVASVVTLLSGQSPSQAFGMLDAVMVETLGMAMHNAVGRQQGGGMVSSAAVTAACAKMLQTPFPIAPAPTPPVPPDPPVVNPLPGPPPVLPPTSAVIAAAFAEGEAAISILQAQAQGAGADATQAQADLAQLAKDAAPSTPPPGG